MAYHQGGDRLSYTGLLEFVAQMGGEASFSEVRDNHVRGVLAPGGAYRSGLKYFTAMDEWADRTEGRKSRSTERPETLVIETGYRIRTSRILQHARKQGWITTEGSGREAIIRLTPEGSRKIETSSKSHLQEAGDPN